ncbi:MAG: hypothetical protein AB1941_11110 [Gemmatimonadota bacterium]
MSQTWNHVRRALVALSFLGAMGFGATQALAAPDHARQQSGSTINPYCDEQCRQLGYDYCSCTNGACACYMLGEG